MKHSAMKICLVMIVFVLLSAYSSCAAQKVFYKVTRWEWNPDTARLEIDFTKQDENYVRTFHIPMMYGDGSDIFFVKGIYGRSEITVPKNWRIDCTRSHVEPIDCEGEDNGDGGVYFSPGDKIFVKRGTDLTIRYLDKENMLDFSAETKSVTFPPLPLVKGAKRELDHKVLEDAEAKLKANADSGKEADATRNIDNCVVKSVSKGTQFSIPEGWFIDTDPPAVKTLRGKGELCFGGIRFREGDTVLFKHKTQITLRKMYQP